MAKGHVNIAGKPMDLSTTHVGGKACQLFDQKKGQNQQQS